MIRSRLIALVAITSCLVGCAGIGPRAIRNERFNYNEAVVRTFDEQMLLNLVRLRYRDTPYFLDVASISTQYEFRGSASAGASIGAVNDSVSVGTGVGYVERPTIVYTPLSGADFARRLLTPMSPESLFLLTGAGWRTDRVLRCGIVRINDVWNAPGASGPTPDRPPVYAEFKEATEILSSLKQRRLLSIDYESWQGAGRLVLRFADGQGDTPERERLRELLGLDADESEFRVVVKPANGSSTEVTVATRSLIGTMYFLSQAVEPPERDRDAGRVTETLNEDGSAFDWSEVLGDILRVHSSSDAPENSFVRVRYRNAWFYIDDSDLSSKSTFNLLGQLFNLQAGESPGSAPLLTLPLGG